MKSSASKQANWRFWQARACPGLTLNDQVQHGLVKVGLVPVTSIISCPYNDKIYSLISIRKSKSETIIANDS